MVTGGQTYSPRGDRIIHANEPDLIVQRLPLLDEERSSWHSPPMSPQNECKVDVDKDDQCWSCCIPISSASAVGHHGNVKCISWEENSSLFPKEKRKTVISFVFMISAFLVNATSIALTHDRVPDREHVPPLPDIVLDNVDQIPELMKMPDVLVVLSMMISLAVVLMHPHRWILARRAFFIIGVLYLLRSVTMYVTVLPVANRTVYCSPKANSTSLSLLAFRVWELSVGAGMQISGQKKSCGDYIYSGHTAMLITTMLFIREYSPSKFWPLHWLSWLMAWSGMVLIMLAHGHYTIDVIIGYFAATRMFWTYHVLANNAQLKIKSDFYGQCWWFRIFQYLEANVGAPLPRLRPSLRLPGPSIRFR